MKIQSLRVEQFKKFDQPVLVGGSMGTASYVLVGTQTSERLAFSSACHGAGRAMSRRAATRDGGEWVLDGPKLWITTGSEAGAFIVFARSGEDRVRGITAFLVERGDAGFGVGKKESKLGIRASDTATIRFDRTHRSCWLPGRKPEKSTSRRSARPSLSVSAKKSTSGAEVTRAPFPHVSTPVGKLSPSANSVDVS